MTLTCRKYYNGLCFFMPQERCSIIFLINKWDINMHQCWNCWSFSRNTTLLDMMIIADIPLWMALLVNRTYCFTKTLLFQDSNSYWPPLQKKKSYWPGVLSFMQVKFRTNTAFNHDYLDHLGKEIWYSEWPMKIIPEIHTDRRLPSGVQETAPWLLH